jgi:hypothetical protein
MGWTGWRGNAARGVLVAGRAYDLSELTPAQVVALVERIDALADKHGAPLVAVPVDVDLSDESPPDDEPLGARAFVGVLVAHGGTDAPLAVPRDAMLAGIQRARGVAGAVWDAIADAVRGAGAAVEDDEIAVRLGSTGELAEAKLGFGVLAPLNAAAQGKSLLHGQDAEGNPHEMGVDGILVAVCSYDTPAEPIDVSDKAHAARVAKSPKGEYWLIAQHD